VAIVVIIKILARLAIDVNILFSEGKLANGYQIDRTASSEREGREDNVGQQPKAGSRERDEKRPKRKLQAILFCLYNRGKGKSHAFLHSTRIIKIKIETEL
jgi:hypothetical protein